LDILEAILFCDKVTLQLIKNKAPQLYSTNPNSTSIKKVPSLIPSCLTKDQLKKLKNCQTEQTTKGIIKPLPSKSFAQVIASVENILKLKKAFSVLPDKKIIKIHNMSFSKLVNKERKIQITTRGPSRKQTIVPILDKHTENIIEDTGSYIHYINNLLKNIKSTLYTEFIQPCARGISITTNNVSTTSNLTIIE